MITGMELLLSEDLSALQTVRALMQVKDVLYKHYPNKATPSRTCTLLVRRGIHVYMIMADSYHKVMRITKPMQNLIKE